MRVAFANIALNTGSSSPGELEMTCNTSDVAVCCSSDSERSSVRWRSSLSSRVFCTAMTACAANVLRSSRCFSESGPGATRTTLIAPIAVLPRIIGMMVIARYPLARKFLAPGAIGPVTCSVTSGKSITLQSRIAVPCIWLRQSLVRCRASTSWGVALLPLYRLFYRAASLPPRGSGQGIVAAQSGSRKGPEMGWRVPPNVRFGS